MKLFKFCFVDIETTGLDPSKHEMTQFACVTVRDGQIISEINKKIKPQNLENASPKALEISGYSDEAWADAAPIGDCVEDIYSAIRGRIFVAHNASFDYSFLHKAFTDAGMIMTRPAYFMSIDTMGLAHANLEPFGLENLKLKTVCEFLNIPNEGAHDALIDAHRCRLVFDKIYRPSLIDKAKWSITGARHIFKRRLIESL